MKPWFTRGHFLPRDIERDHVWQRLNESHKKVYRYVSEHSYLTQKSPSRRYCEWTYKQIGEHVGLSARQTRRIMKELMRTRLIYRWYKGDSGANGNGERPRSPRYEIPASRGMVIWWRYKLRTR